MSNALSLALRFACCLLASWALWRAMGLSGLVVSAPLYGVLFARPIIDLLSAARHSVRAMALADIQGRHFAHRGYSLDVIEDDDHFRWIALEDVKKLLPGLPRPQALASRFPGRVRLGSPPRESRILAEALLDYLATSTEPDSIRFRIWLERVVIAPGATVRDRLGIRGRSPADSG
jgi:hypothetical protein